MHCAIPEMISAGSDKMWCFYALPPDAGSGRDSRPRLCVKSDRTCSASMSLCVRFNRSQRGGVLGTALQIGVAAERPALEVRSGSGSGSVPLVHEGGGLVHRAFGARHWLATG